MENPYATKVQGHEGEVLTYRQFCDLLGIEFKRGKAKELQLKKVQQYMKLDLKTISGKIIVQSVYGPTEIELLPQRGTTFPYIKNMLLLELQKQTQLCWRYTDFMQKFKMVSWKYWDFYHGETGETNYAPDIKDKFLTVVDPAAISEINIDIYINIVRKIITEAIRSSLRQLQSNGLITTKSTLILMRQEQYVDFVDKKEKFRVIKHTLSEEEQQEFEKIRENIMDRYSIISLHELFHVPKNRIAQEIYVNKIKDYVHNLPGNWDFYATAYILEATQKGKAAKIDKRYLDCRKLREQFFIKVQKEKSIAQLIPAPMLPELVNDIFGSL